MARLNLDPANGLTTSTDRFRGRSERRIRHRCIAAHHSLGFPPTERHHNRCRETGIERHRGPVVSEIVKVKILEPGCTRRLSKEPGIEGGGGPVRTRQKGTLFLVKHAWPCPNKRSANPSAYRCCCPAYPDDALLASELAQQLFVTPSRPLVPLEGRDRLRPAHRHCLGLVPLD